MAFFTRTKPTIPVLPTEEGEIEEILSEDDWEVDLEERRTPDGRSSKTSYELRREPPNTEDSQKTVIPLVVECKNPIINAEESFEEKTEDLEKEGDIKTEDVRYDFVVDRVLGVQV